MIKRSGRLSVGALLAALFFSHISVAKAGDIISNRLVEIIENKKAGEKMLGFFTTYVLILFLFF